MAARGLADASCHALRRAVHDKLRAVYLQLRACHRSFASGASSPTTTTAPAAVAALGALLCVAAAFPRAAAFFLPLVASTSLCCAAACLFAAEERGAVAKEAGVEVVLVGGEGKAEAGLLQVIGDANASKYADVDGLAGGGGVVQVGCFLRRSARWGVDKDGEEVVFAGTLAPCAAGFGVGVGAGTGQRRGALEEELAALRVDRLAEGVWDSYFGRWSRWHHIDATVSYCS